MEAQAFPPQPLQTLLKYQSPYVPTGLASLIPLMTFSALF